MSVPYPFLNPQQNPYINNTGRNTKRLALITTAIVVLFFLATTLSFLFFSYMSDSSLIANIDKSSRIITHIETGYPYTADNTDYQLYPDSKRTYYASSNKAQEIFPTLSHDGFSASTPQYEQALSVSGSQVYSFTTTTKKAATADNMKNSSDPVLHYSLSIVATVPQYSPTSGHEERYETIAHILDEQYDYDAIGISSPEEQHLEFEEYRPYFAYLLKGNTLTIVHITYTGTLAFITADTVNLNTEAGIETALPNGAEAWDIMEVRKNIYNNNYDFVDIRKGADETLEYAAAAKDLSDDELLTLLESAPVHSTSNEYTNWPSHYTEGMVRDTDWGSQVMTIDGREQRGENMCEEEAMQSAKPFIVDFNDDGIRDIITTPVSHPCGVGGPEQVWYDATGTIVIYTPTLEGTGLEILTQGELKGFATDHVANAAENLFLEKHPDAERSTSEFSVHWIFREYNIEDKDEWCTERNAKEYPDWCEKATIDANDPIVISAENSEIKVNLLRGLSYAKPVEGEDFSVTAYSYKHYIGTFTLGDDGLLHLTDIE